MTVRALAMAALICGAVGAAVYPLIARRNSSSGEPTVQAGDLPAVRISRAEARPMTRSVLVPGVLKSGSQAALSPKQGGKVLAVLVTEGQSVRRGQVLIQFDTSDAARQAEQARAAVAAARANVEKARTGSRLRHADIERRVREARVGVEQASVQLQKAMAGVRLLQGAANSDVLRAQAGVDAAKSALNKAKRGARPEERRQLEIVVKQAERGVDAARKNLTDVEYLFGKGGAPRVQVEAARESHQSALDALSKAKIQLEILNAGAAPEDIAAAEAQLRSAEAGLAAAKMAANRGEVDDADIAGARGALKQAQDGLRSAEEARMEQELSSSETRAAQAAYNQAVAAYELAAQQVATANISSPLDGIATHISIRAGEMAGPGMPLLTVVGTAGVYLDGLAPARIVQSLRAGQKATVIIDTLRGKSFSAHISSIGAVAGADGRSYPIRIDLAAAPGILKPGATARATVVTEFYPEAVTVPDAAVRSAGDRTNLWIVRGGKVLAVPVEPGIESEGRIMVTGDVRAGDPVVLSADAGVQPGQSVRSLDAAPIEAE